MSSELYRLATFSSWSVPCSVSPLLLAKIGFSYLGMSDTVECFACKEHLTGWSTYDHLQQMHKQKAPKCQPVNGSTSANIPLKILDIGIIGTNDTETDVPHLDADECKTIEPDLLTRILHLAHKRASSKGVFSSIADCEIDRSKPDYEKLRREELRLRTFHDWPQAARADPKTLAQEGLFYTGVDDRVQCAFCHGFMRNWEPTDIPSTEHKKHFPDCPFVRDLDVGNVPALREPIDAGHTKVNENDGQMRGVFQERLRGENPRESIRPSTREQVRSLTSTTNDQRTKFPEYADVAKRVESFLRGQVAVGHTAESLADAGWFWIGPADKVQCFHCGGNLKDWEPEDEPWEEHKRWYSDCSYLRMNFPTPRRQFQEPPRPIIAPVVGPYRIEPREVKARLDTATVRAILNMGYPRDRVKMAIEKRLSTTGDDFPNAESLLEALFQLEEVGIQSNGATASGLAVTSAKAEDNSAYRLSNGSTRSSVSDNGYNTMSSASSARSSSPVHHHDSFTSLPPRNEPSAHASSSAPFQSMVLTALALTTSSSTAAAMTTQADLVTDAQSKSKGKKKRNKKKKTSAASNGAIGEEAETSMGAQNDVEKLRAEGDPNLEEIPDEESVKYLEENRQLREARTCKVCMDAEVNTVFLPCGHLVCCNECSPQLRVCPICRTFIRGTVKTFLS